MSSYEPWKNMRNTPTKQATQTSSRTINHLFFYTGGERSGSSKCLHEVDSLCGMCLTTRHLPEKISCVDLTMGCIGESSVHRRRRLMNTYFYSTQWMYKYGNKFYISSPSMADDMTFRSLKHGTTGLMSIKTKKLYVYLFSYVGRSGWQVMVSFSKENRHNGYS